MGEWQSKKAETKVENAGAFPNHFTKTTAEGARVPGARRAVPIPRNSRESAGFKVDSEGRQLSP